MRTGNVRKDLLLGAFWPLLSWPASAAAEAPPLQWQRTFGGAEYDAARAVRETSDGGFIAAGVAQSFSAGNDDDVYLIKTDSRGELQWERTFGGAGVDWGYSVRQTADGGFVVAGWTGSSGAGDYDLYLIKTNGSGQRQWERTFGGPGDDRSFSVKQTGDGGYVVAGWTRPVGQAVGDVYLVKTDGNGQLQWQRTFGGPGDDAGLFVCQTADGGYIITGWTGSFGAGDYDVYLLKADTSGTLQWQRAFGGAALDWGRSVEPTADGGYVIGGWTASFGAGSDDVYLVKTDSSGTLQWQRTYGGAGQDWGYSVQQTRDGGYAISGWTASFGVANHDVYLVKTDADGAVQWQRTFGGAADDTGLALQQTADDGYVIAGWTGSFGAGMNDAYLVKLGPVRPPAGAVRSWQLYE